MKFKVLLLFVCLYCLSGAAFAQKTWEKPFQKWNKDEAFKILSDSPWAQSYQAESASAQLQSGREQNDQRILGRAETGRVTRLLGNQPVVIRFQSALPIRQALVRLQQIQSGYDKMNEEQRAKFDAGVKEFLNCLVCQNYYVVTLTKHVLAAGQGVDDGMFQTLRLEDLKGKVRLVNDRGEERELIQFIAPERAGESAVLFFKRRDDKGTALITPQSKELELVFNTEFLQNRTNPYGGLLQRRFEFKVSKLMTGENVEL